jgi:hypothetical protein
MQHRPEAQPIQDASSYWRMIFSENRFTLFRIMR